MRHRPRRRTMARLILCMVATAPAGAECLGELMPITGRVVSTEHGAVQATERGAAIQVWDGRGVAGRVRFQLQFASSTQGGRGVVMIAVGPTDPAQPVRSPALARLDLVRSAGQHDGKFIQFRAMRYLADTGKWDTSRSETFSYEPVAPRALQRLRDDGYEPQSWLGRWIPVRLDVRADAVSVYVEGTLVDHVRLHTTDAAPIVLWLPGGDAVRAVRIEPLLDDPLYLPIDLTEWANHDEAVEPPPTDIPFDLAVGGQRVLSLRQAQWIDRRRDPQTYYEEYDGSPYRVRDDRQPMVQAPRADYLAAHVLAVADPDPDLADRLTLRVGRYGYREQVFQRDHAVTVPRDPSGRFTVVRVPITGALNTKLMQDVLDIELTKEVRYARHLPDPNRFRFRPLGLPSGVRVAAVTLERSPVQWRVGCAESGHVFVEPRPPAFQVELTNITTGARAYRVEAACTYIHGGQTVAAIEGVLEPGQAVRRELPVTPVRRGYHDVTLTLTVEGTPLLEHVTSFATIPPIHRPLRHRSPFGTWEWMGTHLTPTDSDLVGELFEKLGFRYGMNRHPLQKREQYGVVSSLEPRLAPGLKVLANHLESTPDARDVALMFHENAISAGHVTRACDLFTDRPPYQLSEKERQQYEKMLAEALAACREARLRFPHVKISFGNGVHTTKEEFYRRGFPAELFDFGGNESGSFHRPPEAQPPDVVAFNAGLWMDRQLLDAYGYADKKVYACLEIGYPGDNAGNHTPAIQADYFARLALHGLAWELPFINPGMLTDIANSYYFSNWGASGFCRALPEVSAKPAFVALATLTTVLDGATFQRVHDTGSATVYALEFHRPDGSSVLAYWTIHGRRPMTVQTHGGRWRVINDQGVVSPLNGQVIVTSSPNYLVGQGAIGSITLGDPQYDDAPPEGAVVVASLDSLEGWKRVDERSAELEFYNPLTPRRRGDFAIEPVATFAGRGPVLRVEPRPIAHGKATMPMYERLARADAGVELPGKPNEIGLWVHGNSGWGRVIFELRDAAGQRWVSIGMAAAGEPHPWLLDWMTPELLAQVGDNRQQSDWNTNDAYHYSSINFDGWRYVAFPLPGNYPGEQHPWPDNCFWRCEGDGVVRYPLRLTGIALEIPEKVLHVKNYAPVPRQAIFLHKLTVGVSPRWVR